jgi:ligand-binding SRPBCC domain-containing protein
MDEQRVGPYKLWLHTHSLEEVTGGTKMTDEIRYQMPFGPIGSIAHFFFVRRTLKQIFDYRREKLDEIFLEK